MLSKIFPGKSAPVFGMLMVAALFLPQVVTTPYTLHILILAAMFGILAMYWNLLDGYIGIINFGYAAFLGIGAYCSALLALKWGFPVFISIPLGGILAGITGFLIMIPCLKMPSFSVAIVTIAFAEITKLVISSWTEVTRGEMGLWGIPPLFEGLKRQPYLSVILVILLLSAYLLIRIVHSPLGFSFIAVRDDELAAASFGIKVKLVKLIASSISCFFAGCIGAFYAHYILVISPGLCTIPYTIQIMAMSLLGGKGTIWGPLIGAFVLVLFGESLRALEDYRLLFYGLIIMVVILFIPGGFMDLFQLSYKKIKQFWSKVTTGVWSDS